MDSIWHICLVRICWQLVTVVDCIIDMRKLGKILDNESTGRARRFMASNQQPKNPISNFQFRRARSVLIARQQHVWQYVLCWGGLALCQINLPLLNYLMQLAPDEFGGLYGCMKWGPWEVNRHRYDSGVQQMDWMTDFFHFLWVLKAQKQAYSKTKGVAIFMYVTHIIYHIKPNIRTSKLYMGFLKFHSLKRLKMN